MPQRVCQAPPEIWTIRGLGDEIPTFIVDSVSSLDCSGINFAKPIPAGRTRQIVPTPLAFQGRSGCSSSRALRGVTVALALGCTSAVTATYNGGHGHSHGRSHGPDCAIMIAVTVIVP